MEHLDYRLFANWDRQTTLGEGVLSRAHVGERRTRFGLCFHILAHAKIYNWGPQLRRVSQCCCIHYYFLIIFHGEKYNLLL